MVKIVVDGKDIELILPDKKARELGLDPAKGYEFYRAKNDTWVLTQKEPSSTKSPPEKSLDEQILKILKIKTLSQRVEGKFEKFLNPEQLKVFRQMLESGQIVLFKLSDKYSKGVYKTKKEIDAKKPIQNRETEKKFSLSKHGFTVVQESEAKSLSEEFEEKIKNKELLGTRDFSGEYFVITKELFDKFNKKVLNLLENNSPLNLEELSKSLSAEKKLIKGICLFLQEDGEIIEKTRESYSFVG